MGQLLRTRESTETDDTVNPSRHCSDLDTSSRLIARLGREIVNMYVPLEKLKECRMNRIASAVIFTFAQTSHINP